MKLSPLGWDEVEQLVNEVYKKIQASNWEPDVIVGLSRGGFIPATMLAYKLQVATLVGLDVIKDDSGKRARGSVVSLGDVQGKKVLVVDDSTISGRLLRIVPEEVSTRGGEPRSCALISLGQCDEPDYLAKTETSLPLFPWE